tara:strand:- start:465 stop:875 length:411 start_codon:yes stop_codon:yes gene_type:complete
MTNDEGFRFLTKPLTQDKVNSFLKEYLPDNVRPAMVARKIILVDIGEYGLKEWAFMNPDIIVDNFKEAVEELNSEIVSDIEAMIEQQDMLDNLGIDQDERLDSASTFRNFSGRVVELFDVLSEYFAAQYFIKETIK